MCFTTLLCVAQIEALLTTCVHSPHVYTHHAHLYSAKTDYRYTCTCTWHPVCISMHSLMSVCVCVWFSKPCSWLLCPVYTIVCILVQLIHVYNTYCLFSPFSSCFFSHYFPFFLASVLYTYFHGHGSSYTSS